MSATKSSGPPAGYDYNPEDGLFRRVVYFGDLRTVLVRARSGRLVRVERPGSKTARFFIP